MKHRILIVIPNCEMRDFILDILEEQFKDSSAIMEIDKEETYQDAVDKCGDSNPYSLVISQLHIPRHRKAPLVEKDMLGLELFRKLSLCFAFSLSLILFSKLSHCRSKPRVTF